MMRTSGLGKCFNASHWAVRDLDLQVPNGSLVMLLGANGAGKSTTINCFLDFIRPTEGVAVIDETIVATNPIAAKRNLSYLAESLAVYTALSGIQNVIFFAGLGTSKRLSREQAQSLLEQLSLSSHACHRPVKEYSKGMRQKLGLAIALARNSGNIILDEPTTGLDPVSARHLMDSLLQISRSGAAVMMTTHDVFRAGEADTVYVMKAGRLVSRLDASSLRTIDVEREYLRIMAAA